MVFESNDKGLKSSKRTYLQSKRRTEILVKVTVIYQQKDEVF